MGDGKEVKVIENSEGGRTTPSIIAYTENKQTLIGQSAKRQAVNNPENTFFAIKRLIGRKFEEKSIQNDIVEKVPYKIIKSNNGDAWVETSSKKTISTTTNISRNNKKNEKNSRGLLRR